MAAKEYLTPADILMADRWAKKHGKDHWAILKVDIHRPRIAGANNTTYYPVELMLPPSEDAPADAKMTIVPFHIMHNAHVCKYGIKEVEPTSTIYTRSVTFGPHSEYTFNKIGEKPVRQPYGEAKRLAATWVIAQLKHWMNTIDPKTKTADNPDGTPYIEKVPEHKITTGVRFWKEVTENNKKTKVRVKEESEHTCSVEIPFKKPSGGGRPPDSEAPSIKIADAATGRKNANGRYEFDPAKVGNNPLNFGNIHHFVNSGSKFMGVEDCGSVSYTNLGYSWSRKWTDGTIIAKGSGGRSIDYQKDVDDSAFDGMINSANTAEEDKPVGKPSAPHVNPEDEAEEPVPAQKPPAKKAAAVQKPPAKKPAAVSTEQVDFVDDDEVTPVPAVATKPAPPTDDLLGEVEPPKPKKAGAKKKPAPVVVDEDEF